MPDNGLLAVLRRERRERRLQPHIATVRTGEGKRTPEAGHRFAFRKFKKGRKIRKGFDVDHLCRHWFPDRPKVIARMCVNPDHLEEVRPVVNQARRRKDAVQERIRREYAEELTGA